MLTLSRIAAAGFLALLFQAAPAGADGRFGDNFTFHGSAERNGAWTGPSCEDAGVIARVRKRFAATENAYWESDLRMDAVEYPREIAWRDWTPTITAIRSCRAKAALSDGRTVSLVYWVRSEQGVRRPRIRRRLLHRRARLALCLRPRLPRTAASVTLRA